MLPTRKSSQHSKNTSKQVHVNFIVSEELRNSFKSKTAMKGKQVKAVLEEFMKEYIKKP
jgi:hypothetical protein